MTITDWPNEVTVATEDLLDLVAQVGHDVRSPLTAICSYAECLAWAPAADGPRRERYARAVAVETRRISRMLADFAVLAGQRRGGTPRELDIGGVLAEAFDALGDLLSLRGIALEPDIVGPYPTLTWPPEILRQIVVAALDTIIVVSPGPGALRVAAAAAGGAAVTVTMAIAAEPMVTNLPRLLSYQAAVALLAERGGHLALRGEGGVGLELLVPADGSVARLPGAPVARAAS